MSENQDFYLRDEGIPMQASILLDELQSAAGEHDVLRRASDSGDWPTDLGGDDIDLQGLENPPLADLAISFPINDFVYDTDDSEQDGAAVAAGSSAEGRDGLSTPQPGAQDADVTDHAGVIGTGRMIRQKPRRGPPKRQVTSAPPTREDKDKAWLKAMAEAVASHNDLSDHPTRLDTFLSHVATKSSLAEVDAAMGYSAGTCLTLLRWNAEQHAECEGNASLVEKDRRDLRAFKGFFDALMTDGASHESILTATITADRFRLKQPNTHYKIQGRLWSYAHPDVQRERLPHYHPGDSAGAVGPRTKKEMEMNSAKWAVFGDLKPPIKRREPHIVSAGAASNITVAAVGDPFILFCTEDPDMTETTSTNAEDSDGMPDGAFDALMSATPGGDDDSPDVAMTDLDFSNPLL
ncbi:uncharacterized protein MKK02DRAFT_29258 [Dioszegia hungarica]|uniref:Uncharacterized protein n=1 Tax=Dioszegia hungarica TaxID=4972 RepID=A0AA38LYK2_9TREE|nr:uncharacterized protein MKK02DRAFT_29258 [Dioszegia hungarica]KAI9639136.1 hypothetical protein MKK02DRAFT_29258 [Dioszegia hungarica]